MIPMDKMLMSFVHVIHVAFMLGRLVAAVLTMRVTVVSVLLAPFRFCRVRMPFAVLWALSILSVGAIFRTLPLVVLALFGTLMIARRASRVSFVGRCIIRRGDVIGLTGTTTDNQTKGKHHG